MDTAQAEFGFPNFNERRQTISKQVEEKAVNALENLNEPQTINGVNDFSQAAGGARTLAFRVG
jgi:hypothetical protein